MAGPREDYLIRLIEDLRVLVERAVALRDTGQLSQALQAVVAAQEKLFARPAAEFMARPFEEQIRLLTIGESADSAKAKLGTHAAILEEAARIYAARGRDDLAGSARQLALRASSASPSAPMSEKLPA